MGSYIKDAKNVVGFQTIFRIARRKILAPDETGVSETDLKQRKINTKSLGKDAVLSKGVEKHTFFILKTIAFPVCSI